MTARPTEIKALVELLEQPADTIQDLAKALINRLDEVRQDRTDYLVLRRIGVMLDAFGPYPTRNSAGKAIESGKIPALDGARFQVVPMHTPHKAEQAFVDADVSPISEEARRQWEIARNGGQAAKTSNRRRRRTA